MPTGVDAVDVDTWLVMNLLKGGFPGGVVDLGDQFWLAGDVIVELLIVLRTPPGNARESELRSVLRATSQEPG